MPFSHHDRFVFAAFEAREVPEGLLQECAALFSGHYGRWSRGGSTVTNTGGSSIRLSASRLRQDFLFDPTACCLVAARDRNTGALAGHALGVRFRYDEASAVWITQLVVHGDHRRRGIATELCRRVLLFRWGSPCAAAIPTATIAGIATSNPLAIRSLMSAAHEGTAQWCQERKERRLTTYHHAEHLLAATGVPYLQHARVIQHIDDDRAVSVIDTQFFVDHERVVEEHWSIVEPSVSLPRPLPEGHEYVVVVEM